MNHCEHVKFDVEELWGQYVSGCNVSEVIQNSKFTGIPAAFCRSLLHRSRKFLSSVRY